MMNSMHAENGQRINVINATSSILVLPFSNFICEMQLNGIIQFIGFLLVIT